VLAAALSVPRARRSPSRRPGKLGEYRAWSDDECAAFEQRWAQGTMQRRAYDLAKYTGRRCGDLARMTRANCKDGSIKVVQQKTGAELWMRQHKDLIAELASVQHLSLLTTAKNAASILTACGRLQRASAQPSCVIHEGHTPQGVRLVDGLSKPLAAVCTRSCRSRATSRSRRSNTQCYSWDAR